MDTLVREAVVSAMHRLKRFDGLDKIEFEKELLWQLRNVNISSKNRILWKQLSIGTELLESFCISQGWRCYYCGGKMELGGSKANKPTFEHLIPLSKGGPDHPDNMVAACRSCNTRRGNIDIEIFKNHGTTAV